MGRTRIAVSLMALFLFLHPDIALSQADEFERNAEKLKSTTAGFRRTAAEFLGESKDPRAVELLTVALKGEDWVLRSAAAKALGRSGDRRAVEPPVAALIDEHPIVREHAAEALGKLEYPRAVAPPLAGMKDREQNVRRSTGEALSSVSAPAVEPLFAALKDPDDRVRWVAAEALGNGGDEKAVSPLIAALADRRAGLAIVVALSRLHWRPGSDKKKFISGWRRYEAET